MYFWVFCRLVNMLSMVRRVFHGVAEMFESGSFVERAVLTDDGSNSIDVTRRVMALHLERGFKFGLRDVVGDDIFDMATNPRLLITYRSGIHVYRFFMRHESYALSNTRPRWMQMPITPGVFSLDNVRYFALSDDGLAVSEITALVRSYAGPHGTFGAEHSPTSSVSIPLTWITNGRGLIAMHAHADTVATVSLPATETISISSSLPVSDGDSKDKDA